MAGDDHGEASLNKGDTIERVDEIAQKMFPTGITRLTLRPHGWVTVRLLRWGEDGVEVQSPVLGKAKMLPSAIGEANLR